MVLAHRIKIIALVLACAAMCLACPASSGVFPCVFSALAEPAEDPLAEQRVLDISFFIKPGEMVAPGEASLTFTIANRSDFDIQNVYLSSSDGTLSEPIGQIGAGETQTLVRSHSVTQEELDAGAVTYVISHDPLIDGSEKITYTVSAPVAKGEAQPSVDFTRQISSSYVTQGNLVTITYCIRNTGNVALSNLRLRDSLGDFVGRLEVLDINESKTFTSRVTINEESASAPELEYTTPDGETVTRSLDAATIHIAESALDATFSVGVSVFNSDIADAILTLSNAGNADYTNITVIDDVYGGVIADSISLPKGGNPVEVAYAYPIRGEALYRWRITGTSEAGEEVDFVTDTMSLETAAAEDAIAVAIDVVPRMTKINQPGWVTFDVEILNTGTNMAQDALLYEVTRGELRELAVLPTGEATSFPISLELSADAQFIFCLNYTDENGHARTVSTAPIQISIAPDGETPELPASDSLDLDGNPVKMGGASSSFMILLVIFSALLLVLIIALFVTSRRVRRARRQRQAAEKRRIKEELGKTNRFTPVKRTDARKK